MLETSKHKYSYNFSWLGRPIIQYPQDIVAIQEIIWRVRPTLIIETGIAHGGSLIFNASMLALLDYCNAARNTSDPPETETEKRQVLGIDIDIRTHNRAAIESHPLAGLITMIEGSSVAESTVAQVRAIARNHQRILVCLDSNHTHDHVLDELISYAPLVTPNSYCVVFDTVIEHMPQQLHAGKPWAPGNNPMTAVKAYLETLVSGSLAADGRPLAFEVDCDIENQLLVTVAPGGYLKRVDAVA
jgi:cephalosporin hydroxylase